MTKTMVQHGNSAALIIEKPIMELLNIDMKTPLEITTDGANLIISPVHDAKHEGRVKKALTKVNAAHGATLRKLAQ